MTNYQIDTIVDGLRDAIRVCADVDGMSEDYEKSYPYAAGYVIFQWNTLMKTFVGCRRTMNPEIVDSYRQNMRQMMADIIVDYLFIPMNLRSMIWSMIFV